MEWVHGPLGAGGQALIHVRADDQEAVRMLAHTLVRRGLVQVPACTAVVPVPRGAVEIECLDDDGSLLWRRHVDAEGPHVYVPVRDA
jgi:hypothetical protein